MLSSLSYVATGASKVMGANYYHFKNKKFEAAVANSAFKALESDLLMQFNETVRVIRLCHPTGTAFVIQLEQPMYSNWNCLCNPTGTAYAI